MSGSSYLELPIRSEAEARAETKVRFRFYATGKIFGDCETVNVWAETAEQAAEIIRDRAGLENFRDWEVDPIPDCCLMPDRSFLPLDRAQGQKIALAHAYAKGRR